MRNSAAKYPLELISPKNDDSMNSTFGHRDAVDRATAALHLNSADAASRGIQSARPGAHLQRPRLLRAGRRGGRLACLPAWSRAPSVRWARRAPDKRSINALTSERLTDAGGGPTFYSCLVQVERIGD